MRGPRGSLDRLAHGADEIDCGIRQGTGLFCRAAAMSVGVETVAPAALLSVRPPAVRTIRRGAALTRSRPADPGTATARVTTRSFDR